MWGLQFEGAFGPQTPPILWDQDRAMGRTQSWEHLEREQGLCLGLGSTAQRNGM